VQEREARELSRLDKLISSSPLPGSSPTRSKTVPSLCERYQGAGRFPVWQCTPGRAGQGRSRERPGAGAGTTADPGDAGEAGWTVGRVSSQDGGTQQSVEAKLADFGNRMETRLQQEQAQALARQQQEQALKQQQEQTKTKEPEIEREHSRGFGIAR
jgi:hypothetical protein